MHKTLLTEEEVNDKKAFNHRLATMAWGGLLIWWGVVIAVDPFTIAIGAIGTGLILLGVNAIRTWRGIPIKNDNNVLGAIAIVWGVLDQARHLLGLSPWLSLALLLFVVGFAYLLVPLLARPKPDTGDQPGDV